MSEAAVVPASLAAVPDAGVNAFERDAVTFAELVWAHYLRQQEVAGPSPYGGPREQLYQAFRRRFEREQGEIVDEYWCRAEASAAVLTVKRAPLPLRLLGKDPTTRLHRATHWTTEEKPAEVSALIHQCENLGIRVGEVLRGTAQRIGMHRLFATTAHLLALVDGPTPPAAELEGALALPRRELATSAAFYDKAGTRTAQVVYFWGMMIGMWWVAALGLGLLPLLDALDLTRGQLQDFYGCLAAGAVGAIVSVLSRMTTSSFGVDYEVGRTTLRRLGSFRPFVGAVFGSILFLALASGLVHVQVPDSPRRFAFYAVFAFLAGFSERWATDMLGSVGESVAVVGAAPPAPPVAPAPDPADTGA